LGRWVKARVILFLGELLINVPRKNLDYVTRTSPPSPSLIRRGDKKLPSLIRRENKKPPSLIRNWFAAALLCGSM
jgi:hypothetical protein